MAFKSVLNQILHEILYGTNCYLRALGSGILKNIIFYHFKIDLFYLLYYTTLQRTQHLKLFFFGHYLNALSYSFLYYFSLSSLPLLLPLPLSNQQPTTITSHSHCNSHPSKPTRYQTPANNHHHNHNNHHHHTNHQTHLKQQEIATNHKKLLP